MAKRKIWFTETAIPGDYAIHFDIKISQADQLAIIAWAKHSKKVATLAEKERVTAKAKRLKRFNEYSWGVENDEDGQYVLYRDVLKIIGAKND